MTRISAEDRPKRIPKAPEDKLTKCVAVAIYHAAFAQYGGPRDKFYPWAGIGEDQKDFCRHQAVAAMKSYRKVIEKEVTE